MIVRRAFHWKVLFTSTPICNIMELIHFCETMHECCYDGCGLIVPTTQAELGGKQASSRLATVINKLGSHRFLSLHNLQGNRVQTA